MADMFADSQPKRESSESVEAEYATHADYMDDVRVDLDERLNLVRKQLLAAHAWTYEINEHSPNNTDFLTRFFDFEAMSSSHLAEIWISYPDLFKPIITAGNIAERAIKRDLALSINTYVGVRNPDKALKIAEYTLPHIRRPITLSTLLELDRHAFIDKEIRKKKGQWELLVKHAVQDLLGGRARKRRVMKGGWPYEVDVVYPADGEAKLGVDVKRIEALQDTQKRSSEDIDRARAFKDPENYPNAQFGQIVYFPFDDMREGLEARHRDDAIDGIYFAGHSKASVERAVRNMLNDFGLLQTGTADDHSASQ